MSIKKAVLFDFDGTIFNTNKLILESWRKVFEVKTGKNPDPAMILSSFGEPLEFTMEKFFPDDVEYCLDLYRSYQKKIFFDMVEICPGMDDLIKKLKTLGFRNAIVTSRLVQSTMDTLDKFDLAKYFDTVVTCDDTEKHKPEPEPALLALERLGVKPEEAVMIGDSHFDILCAQNAGITSVLVDWSEAAKATPAHISFTPDYRISEARQLLDILK